MREGYVRSNSVECQNYIYPIEFFYLHENGIYYNKNGSIVLYRLIKTTEPTSWSNKI